MNASKGFKQPFWTIVAIALAVKLWLTSMIVLNPVYGPHDYVNFLEHGKDILGGAWFGPYSEMTLIKGPTTPLYVAFLREFNIPVPLAHQLIFAMTALLVCVAIKPIVRSGWILGSLFTFVLFDPMTFDSNAWLLNRSQLIDTLSLAAIASAMGIVIRARSSVRTLVGWFVTLGCSLAATVMTREDTIWVYPPVIFLLAVFAWIAWTSRRGRPYRLGFVAIPPIIVVIALTTIMTINHRVYGWRTSVELTSPEFTSAYQAYTRIVVPGIDQRAYNAPHAAREMAAKVSPAAAELERVWDPSGGWQRLACGGAPACNDVTAPWTLWALRSAVAAAGHYTSGTDAREFYVRLSREIDAACADGRLRCTQKSFGLSPPVRPSDFPATISYAAAAFAHGMTYDEVHARRIARDERPRRRHRSGL